MKRAPTVQILTADGGPAFGIMLAGDFTAEHGFGISDLLSRLTIDPDGRMIDGRTMTAGTELATNKFKITQKYYDDETRKYRQETNLVRAISTSHMAVESREQAIFNAQRYSSKDAVTGSWDDRNFKLLAWTEEGHEILDRIVSACASGDLLVFLGNGSNNPFEPSGLVISITKEVPQFLLDKLIAEDKDYIALQKAAEKTGIAKRIEKAKPEQHWHRQYFALRPNWIFEDRKDTSKYPVIFWLNPISQRRFKAGWYTVEQLDAWLEGEGPVILTEAA